MPNAQCPMPNAQCPKFSEYANLVWLTNLTHLRIRVFLNWEIRLDGGLTRMELKNLCQLFHWLK
ncbi:hypothetical protein [Nostoc linckia]|jgi:hypothetical protein|uniref:hypothetical protein n=2 Tax=Nostoc linckia TaxID=92942 RepID=UPI0015D4A4BE|nr:hypothetical protein [Nostoc linckia]